MPAVAVRSSAALRRATRSVKATRAVRDVRVRAGGDGEYGASGTSFYTTTEKQESYDSLDNVLNAKCADPEVRTVIKEQLDACADITEALRSALVTVEGSANTFGDAQLSVDVIADQIMWVRPCYRWQRTMTGPRQYSQRKKLFLPADLSDDANKTFVEK